MFKNNLINKSKKIIIITLFFILINKSHSDDFYDYPLYYLVDACEITQKRYDPEKVGQDEMLEGRGKYRICMNFIMSLSTTLNSRCMAASKKKLSPEEVLTFADLSEVHATQDLIKEVINYSKRNPHFDNQIAWLHASKAISQKWPCKKLF